MDILRLGSRGAMVQMLQLALNRSGYYTGELDGIFGPFTQRAVYLFQSAFGVSPDGIVGAITWQHLIPYIRGYFYKTLTTGDTFWSLAQEYNTTVKAISTANPEVNPDRLRIGQIITIPYGFPVVPTNIDYSFALTELIIDGLSVRYPYIEVDAIGRSVMGKNLYSMTIGNGQTHIFYNATHHANEWITTPLLLKYMEEYAFQFSIGGSIYNTSATALYNNTTLHMVALVDPDGMDLVTGALNSGQFYETALQISGNYPTIPFPLGWKANITGTDLNLNYPAEWERARELKFAQGFVSPAPRDFVGIAPLTAPESRAIATYTQNHDFSLVIAYHTQGQVIYWKYLDYEPPRSKDIGEAMSNASGYPLSETPEYSAYAGYKDWFIQEYNQPGYTIEAGIGDNPLPISQFDEIYNNNIGILTIGMSAFLPN